MRALVRKELREQAPWGVALVLTWAVRWAFFPPLGRTLELSGDGIVLTAFASILVGLALGFAPFELERQRETRAYFVHRGVSIRAVAGVRLAVAAFWVAVLQGVGLALLLIPLQSALVVPDHVGRALRALATTSSISWPALGAGALAGCLDQRARVRWAALILLGLGLAVWGAELSRFGLLDSRAGSAPYLIFCALTALATLWIAVERFAVEVREGGVPRGAQRAATVIVGLALALPVLLWAVRGMQHSARSVAWRSNPYWVRTAEGVLVQRAPGAPPSGVERAILMSHGAGMRLGPGESAAFHPRFGRTWYWDSMLGRRPVWPDALPWAFGQRIEPPETSRHGATWATWIDRENELIVTLWREPWSRPVVDVFELPDAVPGELAGASLRSGSSSTRAASVVVVDAESLVRALVTVEPQGATCRPLSLPDGDVAIGRDFGKVLRFAEPSAPGLVRMGHTNPSEQIFLGERGAYIFQGDSFRRVAEYEPFAPEPDDPERIEARVSRYDALAYDVELRDMESGMTLASGRVAPRTGLERLGALAAIAGTLARAPVASLASSALIPPDDDASGTPSQSLWIDPLVLGGRRPWLVALHFGVAAAIAWATRRRLGGRAWGWPLAVLALGVPAWLVCLLLEPRRAARAAAVQARARAAWAPIVDRASV